VRAGAAAAHAGGGHSLGSVALTQAHLLALANLAHANSLGAVLLTQAHTLAVGGLVVGEAAAQQAVTGAVNGTQRRPLRLDREVDELQERTFRWFTHATSRANGLTPDRWPTESFSSVAAVGFALTCWPIGVERPDSPDDCVTVTETTGRRDGRTMTDGEVIEHPGIQVEVRAADHNAGFLKAKQIATYCDEQVSNSGVTFEGKHYNIINISRVGVVMSIGRESPESRRELFTFNAMVTLTQTN
jgi:hypothetical protein